MITVASHPEDLTEWDQDAEPYYLEILGEAEPVLDMAHAEVVPPGGAAAQTTTATPIYEYWWTMGHGGTKPQHRHLFEGRRQAALWHRLENVAARVYLYFPIGAGWRVQEIAASVKYLAPVEHQADWTQKAAAEWQRLQPIVAGAGQAASALGPVPGIGTFSAGAGALFSAVSKVQFGSVPQDVKGFDWYVEKVTFGAAADHGVMQGVVWAIPKEMFESLGGRLTGSLAVSFVPTRSAREIDWAPVSSPMLAHAAVYTDTEEKWVPAKNRFVELALTPRVSTTT